MNFKDQRAAWIIFLVALILRLLYIFPLSYPLSPDEATYIWGAKQILAGLFFPPTFERSDQSPLYVLFLAAHFRLFGENFIFVRLTQAALGALTAAMTYALAKRITPQTSQVSKNFGSLSGLIVALYPDLIVLNGLLLTETLYTFLLIALILAWQIALDQSSLRWRALAGALAGLTLLTRTSALVFIPLAFAWDIWNSRPTWRIGIQRALVSSAAMLIVLAPWLARNWGAYQTLFPPSYQTSYSLWASNHSGADGTMTALTPAMRAEEKQIQSLPAPERRAYLMNQALTWMREHPLDFVWLAIQKTARFIGVKPDGVFRGIFFGKYVEVIVPAFAKAMLWGLAIVGAIYSAQNWQRLGLIYSAILSGWAITVVFAFAPRYLAPFIPALAILAANGLKPLGFPKPQRFVLDRRARVALILLCVFALNAGIDVARNAGTIAAWQNFDTLSECDPAQSLIQCAPGK
ncbi:MAG: glycosyltransferase family 39 protein [Chloroflexi bacterium]|nr:glycosyltransferase family 39 protein [Chloroflexota bacterium]